MKENRRNRKAFTIVELVIVIAVLAILAAILIPTFASIIKKSEVSADQQLIRNLNTALATARATDGKNNTMYDALQDAKEAGYEISKINANRTQNEILWDSVHDVFVYWNAEKEEIEYLPELNIGTPIEKKGVQLWQIVTKMPDTQDCSIYWNSKNDLPENTTLTVGFDAGDSTITAVKYVGATGAPQDVVIRTNEGNLTIDAENDTVNHYGNADVVEIVAVAPDSYYEHGNTSFIEISTGRLVVCSDSNIVNIHFNFNTTDHKFDNIIIALEKGARLPEFTRDKVGSIGDGILVCEVQEAGAESRYIWLCQDGVYEQITISDSKDSKGSEINNSNSENLRSISQDIANNVAGTDSGLDATEKEKKINEIVNSIQGTGTQDDPLLIKKANQLVLLRDKVNANEYGTEKLYIKLISNIDMTGIDWLDPIGNGGANCAGGNYFSGEFDGDGYTINGLSNNGKETTSNRFALFGYVTDTAYIHDFTLDVNANVPNGFLCAGIVANVTGAKAELTVENVTVTGEIVGMDKVAGFVAQGAPFDNIPGYTRFINCTNKANIKSTGSTSTNRSRASGLLGVTGYIPNVSNTQSVMFTNCANEGTIKAESTTPTILCRAAGLCACLNQANTAYQEKTLGANQLITDVYCNATFTYSGCSNTGEIYSNDIAYEMFFDGAVLNNTLATVQSYKNAVDYTSDRKYIKKGNQQNWSSTAANNNYLLANMGGEGIPYAVPSEAILRNPNGRYVTDLDNAIKVANGGIGGEWKLLKNLTSSVAIAPTVNTEIDMDGHTVKVTRDCSASGNYDCFNNQVTTLKNGTIIFEKAGESGNFVILTSGNKGKAVFKDCMILGKGLLNYNPLTDSSYGCIPAGYTLLTLTAKDGYNRYAIVKTDNIYTGTQSVYKGTYYFDPTDICLASCEAVHNADGTYTVQKKAQSDAYFTNADDPFIELNSFADVIKTGGNWKLNKDITVSSNTELPVNAATNIDLNGHKITLESTSDSTPCFFVSKMLSCPLTISNGTVKFIKSGSSTSVNMCSGSATCKPILKNCTIEGTQFGNITVEQ